MKRSTAEIVADLRSVYGVVRSSATFEAANRLEELEAELMAEGLIPLEDER